MRFGVVEGEREKSAEREKRRERKAQRDSSLLTAERAYRESSTKPTAALHGILGAGAKALYEFGAFSER